MIWWFSFQEIHPVSGFFSPDFSGFISNLQIWSQNGWFTSHILYDDFLFKKFIRFPDFKVWMVFFSSMIYIIYPVSEFFRIFFNFSDFIWLNDRVVRTRTTQGRQTQCKFWICCTFSLTYMVIKKGSNFKHWKFIRFPDFFPDFPGFSWIFPDFLQFFRFWWF